MPQILTSFSTVSNNDPILSGYERYPVIGNAISENEALQIAIDMNGLKAHWNCLEKAHLARSIICRGVVVVGSLMIVSGDLKSEYGYHYCPPYEFHAWIMFNGNIVDVALPGVIDKGLTTHDEYGPYLVGREPVILAGKPESWMKYIPREVQS